jgi:hypothetical protein
MFLICSKSRNMTRSGPNPVLRMVQSRRPSILDNPRAIADFTRVCKIVGIIDSETGLIKDQPQGRPG